MGFMKEFKEFALRGNVIDMAVGVIIGGAFSNIVSSAVNDLFMPVLGIFTNGINFSELYISLDGKHYDTLADAKAASAPVFAYGSFIQNVIQFVILALIIFLFIKAINKATEKLKKPEEEAAPTTKTCPFCKSEIAIDATRCPHCTSKLPDYDPQ